MDIKQIIYFVEVADRGSYSAAAKSLSVTQPTLSIAVQKLEEKLNFSLFAYNQKNLTLTNNGRVFYKYAKEYIDAYNHMVDVSQNIGQGVIGNITIITTPLLCKLYMGDFLSQYHELYPDVSLDVCTRNALYDSIEMINRQEADFCLRSLPIDEYTFSYVPIIKQKLMLGVHKSHRLASRAEVSFKELAEETFLDTSYDYNLHRQFMLNCEAAGFTPKIAMRSNDMDFLASLVEANWGVFLMPESLWKAFEYKNVRMLNIIDANIDWELGLIYKKDAPMSTACQMFLELSQKYFERKKHSASDGENRSGA